MSNWSSKILFIPCCSLLSPPVRDERKGRKTFQITVAESLRHRLDSSLSGTDRLTFGNFFFLPIFFNNFHHNLFQKVEITV